MAVAQRRDEMKRRDFLMTASMATLASALGEVFKCKEPLRVAVVGLGRKGIDILSNLFCYKANGLIQVDVIAACDISRERLAVAHHIPERYSREGDIKAEERKCSFYDDYKKLLNEVGGRLDGVFICTPDFCHCEQALAFMQRGIPVYCELPLAETVDSARKMLLAAQKASLGLFCPIGIDGKPQYKYGRSKLIGELKLLGDIVALQSSRALTVRRVRDTSEQILEFNRNSRISDSDLATFQKFGYASKHEYGRWWQYRKFGLGIPLTLTLEQMVFLLDFAEARPSSVIVAGDVQNNLSHVPAIRTLDFAHAGKRLVAQATIMKNKTNNPCYGIDSVFGQTGAIHFSQARTKTIVENSCFGEDGEWYARLGTSDSWGKAEAEGLLGHVADKTDLEMFDEMDILQHDHKGTPEQIKKLEDEHRRFAGNRHAWYLPENVENQEALRQSLSVVRFVKALETHNLTCEPARRAFEAQVVTEGIEKAQNNDGRFVYSPSMFKCE